MTLLIDLGHSRLKWAVDSADPLQVDALAWQDAQFDSVLAHRWQSLRAPNRILAAASPAHPARELVARLAHECFGVTPQWLSSPQCMAGVRNAYADPETLGVDRFLGLMAVWSAGLAPCVLADCGTALTLDALAADGRHLGGAIVPGLELMRLALGPNLPGLATVTGGDLVDCAATTADAIMSGSAHAVTGAIERFHRRVAARLGGEPSLLLCGGDAETVAAQMDLHTQLFHHAVLRGMQVWARHAP